MTRALWCGFRVTRSDYRMRITGFAALDLLGRSDLLPGVVVIDHDAPYAFCIGGRRQRVVVTTALLDALDQEELKAVLAHEAAHLRQRHYVALLACRTLFRTLGPVFPAFSEAISRVRLYVELSADDSARRTVGARPLRNALTSLACRPAPPGALAASARDVETRIQRLADHDRRLTRRATALAMGAIGVVLLVPLALVAAPAVAMAWEGVCLLG